MLIDTHLHLDDEQFDASRGEVIERATAAGINAMIAVGTTAASSVKCLEIAAEHPSIFAAVGIQPNYVHEAEAGDWEQIVQLSSRPQVVAIGETGLDRYWDHAPFDLQESYFDRHIQLSQQTGLPFIVHMRDCGDEIVSSLEAATVRGPLSGVMHSFTGDSALADRCLGLGLYISFAGMVTYKKSDDLRAVAAAVPDDRILIETDSPYLSPHPKRGQRPNEPALLIHTANCLAETRGVSIEHFAKLTSQNARRLFQFDDRQR